VNSAGPNIYLEAWLLPLLSFVFLVLGGKRWGKTGAYVATGAIVCSFLLSCWGLFTYTQEFSPDFFQERHGEETPRPLKPEDIVLPPGLAATSVGGAVQNTGPEIQYRPGDNRPNAQSPTVQIGEHGRWSQSFKWIGIGAESIRMGLYVDSLTVIMFFMITLIASLIHIFSIGYMHEELHDPVHDPLAVPAGQPPLHRKGRFPRFFTYLSLFCFSMLGLVLADNLFLVFMFWELVGLCSYLLIGFYYERQSASNAANKAFITNRVGDAGFIVGLMIVWTSLGSFNIQDLIHTVRDFSGHMVRKDTNSDKLLEWNQHKSAWLPADDSHESSAEAHYAPGDVQLFDIKTGQPHTSTTITYLLLTVAGIGVFIGCVGKSAQFPLHVWLPDAMEGPTPVSALIHAATMVAAGVYLVGRFYAFFTPDALLVIAYTGGITLFIAGTIAVVMTDIKKVLAYSTVSQLGYMMLGLGVGGWAAGLFHLLTHAFFKALLFLGSGSVIHGTGTQEMPQMGGLWRLNKMPITAVTMLIGVLAICGIPLFSGYYSKDAIVADALYFWHGDGSAGSGHPQHILLFLLPTAGAAITAFYMFRLFFLTFAGEPRDHHVDEHAHESTAVMWVPLAVLAVFSVIVGYEYSQESHTPLLTRMLLFSKPHTILPHPPDAIHHQAGYYALAAVLSGIGMSVLFYGAPVFWIWFLKYFRVLNPGEVARQFPRLHDFLLHKWYFDELYERILIRPTLAIAQFCRSFDWNVLDAFIDGTARVTLWWSRLDGWFDFRVIDGLVNLTSDWVYATGDWLRRFQTGQIRQYVMFLAVGAIGLFAVISFLGADVLRNLLVK